MNATEYRSELVGVGQRLAVVAERSSILGEGPGQFLVAERKNRGVEIYRGEKDEIVVDRALDEQLLGEEVFHSYEAAVAAAAQWLEAD